MNTQIYIFRHAEVVYPIDEEGNKLFYDSKTHISIEGKAQITKFAKQLKKEGVYFDRIITSPFVRAVETAKILAKILGIKQVIKNELFRDDHVPGWFGLPLSILQDLTDEGKDMYDFPLTEDQETKEEIVERMIEGFRGVVKENQGKVVAIVSHGDPIRLLTYRLAHPEGKIPSMSTLSEEGYLKRGESIHLTLDEEGNILESELIAAREGIPGKRELYK